MGYSIDISILLLLRGEYTNPYAKMGFYFSRWYYTYTDKTRLINYQ